MTKQQKHEESGCTDYLQHNADSCPHMTKSNDNKPKTALARVIAIAADKAEGRVK